MITSSATRGAVAARASDPDQVGVVASTLCAAHCLGTGVLAGVSGIASPFANERVEVAFCVCAMTLALTALARGSRRHRSWTPATVGASGIFALAAARCAPLDVGATETCLSVAGGALLAAAHVLNIRALRRAGACCKACDATER